MFKKLSKKKTPRTEAQNIASRQNGSKSQGPTTPEGKRNSSRNRTTHGFRSQHIALTNERRADFTAHLDAYLQRYQPLDKVEADLVGLLATNMWQIMRMNSIEVALFDLDLADTLDEVQQEYDQIDRWGHLALVFKKQAGDNALELLRRYKSTTERAYHRALEAIEKLKKDRLDRSPIAPENKITTRTQESAQPIEQQPVTQPAEPVEPVAIDTHPTFKPASATSKPVEIANAPQAEPQNGSKEDPERGPKHQNQ